MHLGAFQALPLYLSILSGAWLNQPAVMFLSIFISSVDWKTVLKRETRPRCSKSWKAASPGMLLTFPPPQNLISEPTNPDFWGNKSWRLREKSVLMLMQEVGAPVRAHLSRWSMEDDTVPFPKDPNMPAILSAYSFYSFGPNFHPHNSFERSLNHPISKTMYIHDLKSPIQ